MIVGVNKVYSHGGRDYHIQAEDLGLGLRAFEIRVYDGGTVLWRKRIGYGDIVDRNLGRIEQDEALRAMMDKTIVTVQAAISKGKLA